MRGNGNAGEGGRQASWNLCQGEGRVTPAVGIAVIEEEYPTQTATSNWHDTPVFITDPGEKNFASCHHVVFATCKTEAWQGKEVKK